MPTTPSPRESPAALDAPRQPSRIDLLLGESPIAWAMLAVLLVLPLLGSVALLSLAGGSLQPTPAVLRGVGAALLAGGFVLALLVAWLLRGLRRQILRLRAMSVTDPLTGVANRGHFIQALTRELDLARRHGFPLSVAVLDIDHLERINQEHGYPVGDQVIALVAERLAEHLRESDLLARTGGGELAVLLSHLGPEQAVKAARRFRTVLNWQPLALGDRDLVVTASFGVATFAGESNQDLEMLLGRAEAATRLAKDKGRDQVYFLELQPAGAPRSQDGAGVS